MGLTVFFMLVILYILELKYYRENKLSLICPTISLFLFIYQFVAISNNIDIPYLGKNYDDEALLIVSFVSYYIVLFSYAIIALTVSFIPIYQNLQHITLKDLCNHYKEILQGKARCTRSDYWLFFMLAIDFYLIIGEIIIKLPNPLSYINFLYSIIIFIGIIDLIFQSKRFEDANLSKYYLLILLFGFLGNSFFLISLIIVHAFTLLPSDNKKIL